MLDSKASTPQPPPVAGKIDVAPIVIADIEARVAAGKEKYGTPLQTNNGRSALWDLYQELIDACMYTRQRLLEEEQWSETPGLVISFSEGDPVAKTDATSAYNCWVDRQGRFDAGQTYVMTDLVMSAEDAIADLKRGKLVIIDISDIEKVRNGVGGQVETQYERLSARAQGRDE
jgi:hypothetical protein